MQYRDGTEIAIGDRVEAIEQQDGRPTLHSEGTVVCIEDAFVGISFDGFSMGGNLSGRITGNSGWWMYGRQIIPVTTPPLSESEADELAELNDPQKTFLIHAGVVKELVTIRGGNAIAAFIRARDYNARNIYRQALVSLERQKAQLLSENKIVMPIITQDDIQQGIRVFCPSPSEGLQWLLPFTYSPQQCFRFRPGEYRTIPQDLQLKMTKAVTVNIQQNGRVSLYQESNGDFLRFQHYHAQTSSPDCTGDLPLTPPYNTVAKVKKLRDEVQELFGVVNLNSIGTHHPNGFEFDDVHLWEKCTPSPPLTGLWSSPFRNGVRIKVIGHPIGFPEDCIGSVGEIYDVGGTSIHVRFRFEHPSFIERRGESKFFKFRYADVEIVPQDTPRTSRPGVALRNTEEETE